ncbi:MAG: YqjF family protein [Haloglomus sp.]
MRMDTALTTTGRAVLFAHWPVDADRLQPHLPDPLAPDRYDGSAWVSVLAFEVTEARPRALPAGLWPADAFGEVNLRTYVRHDDQPGVYFLSLDAGTRVGAAALHSAMGMPCYAAETTVDVAESSDGIESVSFRSRRSQAGQPAATFAADYGPAGPATVVEAGSLAEFCIERRRWYTATGQPSPYLSQAGPGLRVGEIDRAPWQVAPARATVTENSLGRSLGIDLSSGPTVHFSPGFESVVTTRR